MALIQTPDLSPDSRLTQIKTGRDLLLRLKYPLPHTQTHTIQLVTNMGQIVSDGNLWKCSGVVVSVSAFQLDFQLEDRRRVGGLRFKVAVCIVVLFLFSPNCLSSSEGSAFLND